MELDGLGGPGGVELLEDADSGVVDGRVEAFDEESRCLEGEVGPRSALDVLVAFRPVTESDTHGLGGVVVVVPAPRVDCEVVEAVAFESRIQVKGIDDRFVGEDLRRRCKGQIHA